VPEVQQPLQAEAPYQGVRRAAPAGAGAVAYPQYADVTAPARDEYGGLQQTAGQPGKRREESYMYGAATRPDVPLTGNSTKQEINEFVGKVLGWHVMMVIVGFGIGLGICKALEKTRIIMLEKAKFDALDAGDKNFSDYAFYGVYGVLAVMLMISFVPKGVMREQGMAVVFSIVLSVCYAIMMVFCFMHFRSSFVRTFFDEEKKRAKEQEDRQVHVSYEQFQKLRVFIDLHVYKGIVMYAVVFMVSALSVSMANVEFIKPARIFASGITGFVFHIMLCSDYALSHVFNMGMGIFLVFVPALVILGVQKFILLGKPRQSDWMAVAVISFFDIPRTLMATFAQGSTSPDQQDQQQSTRSN
jgi:Na+-transporting methylmalonyl-CoA/oxaloacetate decarboxylase gamma subunit